jgi:hypothetical protein
VAGWQGPRGDSDLRRWALGMRPRPSSHNRQPWQVDLREPDAITLHVDRERLLPETDPWFRQIVVSQGTFLELLVIALRERGIEPTVSLFPDGEFAPRGVDDRPVARIGWSAQAPAAPKDALFRQILLRHTAKVAYDRERPVAPALLEQLAGALPGGSVVRFDGTVDPARLPALRQLCQDAAVVELGTPRTVMESIRLLRGRSVRDRRSSGRPQHQHADAARARCGRPVRPAPSARGRRCRVQEHAGDVRRLQPQRRGFRLLGTPMPDDAPPAPAGALKSQPVARTCGCSCRPPRSACRCTR